MALTPGTKLGPYEIQSPLGAGGMGEVYRAKDTRLGRDVPIKVLPAAFSRDAVLLEISTNKRASSSSGVSAARAIFEIAIKAQEFHELENRVAELENHKAASTY